MSSPPKTPLTFLSVETLDAGERPVCWVLAQSNPEEERGFGICGEMGGSSYL